MAAVTPAEICSLLERMVEVAKAADPSDWNASSLILTAHDEEQITEESDPAGRASCTYCATPCRFHVWPAPGDGLSSLACEMHLVDAVLSKHGAAIHVDDFATNSEGAS